MNLDETIKYYVEKAEDCEAIVAQWKEKATEYRQTADYLIALKEMQSESRQYRPVSWRLYKQLEL